jgi:hypothetical protein
MAKCYGEVPTQFNHPPSRRGFGGQAPSAPRKDGERCAPSSSPRVCGERRGPTPFAWGGEGSIRESGGLKINIAIVPYLFLTPSVG